ncbi:4Fe-4S dicluster domain-containing protein [Microaerobacter geothermalis]|uniref:4Fe-4S dicluster domain-containing protein n=1 Tax=Microaerobacter geothermalis TaxID=674972 RepID=UPI001F1F37D3|nr:4Fe-4S dicluster domain-containing protein [Microaerobacter geothermalis]MCF6092646.1 4Fe-4S dicluster domain-containing protein [Microaerobacter geothermalis]
MEDDVLDRRRFLKENVQSLVKTFGFFVKEQIEDTRKYIRPPGVVDEQSFLLICNRCGDCQTACPQDIILLLGPKAGKHVGTPILNLYHNPCTLCMKCVEVCPTGALSPTPKEKVKLGVAKINPSRCFAWKGEQPCDYCKVFCPLEEKAVKIEDGKPFIIPERCNGCGECKHYCVSGKDTIQIMVQ